MSLLVFAFLSAVLALPSCHVWQDCPAPSTFGPAALESDVLAYLTLEVTQTAAWTFFLQARIPFGLNHEWPLMVSFAGKKGY